MAVVNHSAFVSAVVKEAAGYYNLIVVYLGMHAIPNA